jgi:hypothetical protein
MTIITTSNEVEQLRKDLNAALLCLSGTEQHDKETLLQANKDLHDENENLVTEIQNVIEEAEGLDRLNGALQDTHRELVQERDALLDTINAHSHVSPTGGMTAKEVEEKMQQVRTEERSRIALMFGERRRWEESMEKIQSQKDGLEQEIDRLRKILLAKQQQDRFPVPSPDGDGGDRGGESAHSWLSTAKGFFNSSSEELRSKQRTTTLLRSSLPERMSGPIKPMKVRRRRGSIDDNGFEAVRSAAAAASKSTSKLNKIISDTKSRHTLAKETCFRHESETPDKSIVSRSCITNEQEDENAEMELADILQDWSLANARESSRRNQNSNNSSSRIHYDENLSDGKTDAGQDEQLFEEFCSIRTRDVDRRNRRNNLTEAGLTLILGMQQPDRFPDPAIGATEGNSKSSHAWLLNTAKDFSEKKSSRKLAWTGPLLISNRVHGSVNLGSLTFSGANRKASDPKLVRKTHRRMGSVDDNGFVSVSAETSALAKTTTETTKIRPTLKDTLKKEASFRRESIRSTRTKRLGMDNRSSC